LQELLQFIEVDRFDEVMVEAGFHRALPVLGLAVTVEELQRENAFIKDPRACKIVDRNPANRLL